ncbi:type VII toxin-antitoxin system MntA family adenylyltransferase antitoxin [Agathobaculum sp.]|uniref:type VII toxin-antitoxin system MntA family adenylyltransferase antitoxin n=1 Tax=Agathobaculum sp. TaxID=2048138 RepID=UPI002A7ED6C1|nr:HI0074 family nucleotidyltransferase substrate-binding subunit [Agathobaculum sp.]MDY3618790.1 HI0074 family nucleotidyltransferase substrate-binding subunit [Agathobaculum sp.]
MEQKQWLAADRVLEQITAVLQKYPNVRKAVLFGSRARGDHRPQSDYDIAVYPLSQPLQEEVRLRGQLDDLDTLYKIDLVIVDRFVEPALLQNIETEGIVIMERSNKRENYCKAVERLREALSEYDANPSDTMRDGVIQRFEFTTELAWKACRENLLAMGYAEVNGPKPVMREAFAHGLVEDETVWIDILNDRNLTSHVYKEQTANEIFERIREKYVELFEALSRFLTDNSRNVG